MVLLMVLEIYSIYEYMTCTNYDNRPYYNDCIYLRQRLFIKQL